jgi:hypothetical protein
MLNRLPAKAVALGRLVGMDELSMEPAVVMVLVAGA